MTWTNKSGSTSTPRSIVRRLQELAQDGKIFVKEINGHSHYSAEPIVVPPKPRRTVNIDGVLIEV